MKKSAFVQKYPTWVIIAAITVLTLQGGTAVAATLRQKVLDIAAGYEHACALTSWGNIVCWGLNNRGQASPPSGSFVDVTAGYFYSCAIRESGEIVCWGLNKYGAPPTGTFQSVESGDSHICAVRTNGEMVCWGNDCDYQVSDTPNNQQNWDILAITAGARHSCVALSPHDETICWGDNDREQCDAPPAYLLGNGDVEKLSAGNTFTCRLKGSYLDCWGDNRWGQISGVGAFSESPKTPIGVELDENWWHLPGDWIDMDAGAWHACGIQEYPSGDTPVYCWGWDPDGRATPPAGNFVKVSAGYNFSCGIKDDGSVECWGEDMNGQIYPPPFEVQITPRWPVRPMN
jgi:alpha-tubulin suppressor-like RCC1 family protein